MTDQILRLESLEGPALHLEAQRRGRQFGTARWELAACLLAVERKQLHLEYGCSSAVAYAVKHLGLDAHLAYEMLRVARALDSLPELSAGLRDGAIPWTSVRELTRNAHPEDDARLADLGRRLSTAEIERLVVRSPRSWEREKCERARAQAATSGEEATLFPAPPASGIVPAAEAGAALPTPGVASMATQSLPIAQGLPDPVAPTAAAPGRSPGGGADASQGLGSPAPGNLTPRIKVEFRFTPQEYEQYQQLAQKIRSEHPGSMSREAILAEICRRALSSESTKTRARTVLVLHYDRPDGGAWMETDRGAVAVPKEEAERALEHGRVVIAPSESGCDAVAPTHATPEKPAIAPSDAKPGAGALPAAAATEMPRHGRAARRRQRVTSATMDALHARSNGRCEQCGRRGFLHVHHTTPWSRGGDNGLDGIVLICSACHSLLHRPDFKTNQTWAAARERAIDARHTRPLEPVLTGAAGP